jgi:hypothetical protein
VRVPRVPAAQQKRGAQDGGKGGEGWARTLGRGDGEEGGAAAAVDGSRRERGLQGAGGGGGDRGGRDGLHERPCEDEGRPVRINGLGPTKWQDWSVGYAFLAVSNAAVILYLYKKWKVYRR